MKRKLTKDYYYERRIDVLSKTVKMWRENILKHQEKQEYHQWEAQESRKMLERSKTALEKIIAEYNAFLDDPEIPESC